MLRRQGYDFYFKFKSFFKMRVPVSQCADEWESEEVAAEMFDTMADRICESVEDCSLNDTDRFEHTKKGDYYEVTAPYLFEAVIREEDYDEASCALDCDLENIVLPKDMAMKVELLDWHYEPAVLVVGE